MTELLGDCSHRTSPRPRTVDYPSIDVRQMARELRLGTNIMLTGGALVRLEWRSCHFGGARVYFQCPRCEGRSCILYEFQSETKCVNQYGCRKCLDMVYPVENEGELQRSVRRNHKAMKRRCYDQSRPHGKPLWMRWPTWRRISDQFAVDAMAYFEDHEKIFLLLKRFNNRGFCKMDRLSGIIFI